MVRIFSVPLCGFMMLVFSCGTGSGIPLEIDQENGEAILTSTEGQSLHFSTWINGVNMTSEAHVFREKRNLVAIHSLEKLDLVITYTFDSTGMILSAKLFNTSKERRDISELGLVKMTADKGTVISREGGLRAGIEFFPGSTAGFCLDVATETPWDLELKTSEREFEYLLNLSSSSLALLPGERIVLPSVRFAFCPCKELSLP